MPDEGFLVMTIDAKSESRTHREVHQAERRGGTMTSAQSGSNWIRNNRTAVGFVTVVFILVLNKRGCMPHPPEITRQPKQKVERQYIPPSARSAMARNLKDSLAPHSWERPSNNI
jgi:hypothetical protein